jgi:hypothetical protein
VFRRLVLARIIEPASKLDAARVLEEAGSRRRRTRVGPRLGSVRARGRLTWGFVVAEV